jgi:LPXTG-site transpeptidase (sortase) family protein
LPGSPALDAGSICETADQRGISRPQGSACDIGAFESKGFTLAVNSGDGQSTGINKDFSDPIQVTVSAIDPLEPVNGGNVHFTPPGSGARAAITGSPATILTGHASVTATANGTAGSYSVVANTAGAATGAGFTLTNTCSSEITVTTNADSGAGSLRQAIADVCDGGTISFDNDYTIPLASQLTIIKEMTITGSGHAVTVSGESKGRVFEVNNDSGTVTLNELSVINGVVTGSEKGGGIENLGRLNVTKSTLTNNTAALIGGGIYNNGNLTVTDSTLTGNMGSETGAGGGIGNGMSGVATITNSSLTGNTANDGGGLFNDAFGTMTIRESTLTGNAATGSYGGGGGINNSGDLSVDDSSITGNSAYSGGGIMNVGGSLTIRNSTLSGNTSSLGGGIYNYTGATLTVRNATISGNTASMGSGIYNHSMLNLHNTILANSPTGGDCHTEGGTVTADHNLITTTANACGLYNGVSGNIIGQDPLLGTLGAYGGSTQSIALLPGSPALDAGSICEAADQRGISRPQGPACDIGAYEATGTPALSINDVTAGEGDSGTKIFNFTVSLSSAAPAGGVTFDIATADGTATAPGDFTARSLTSQSIAAGSSTYTFDVQVNGDEVAEGDETYLVNITNITNATAVDTQGTGTITNDDTTGVTVSLTSGLTTTESGGTATFTVVLDTTPTANVTIAVASNDTTEGTASPASLVFTPGNWSTPQTVTVTGVDDALADGNQAYTIQTATASSPDATYDGLSVADVSVTNTDDDTAGVTVTPTSGLNTTEAGGTDSFTVVLNTMPAADVTIPVASNDTTEGTLAISSLTFTTGNWSTPQRVTVTGVDDALADGDEAYDIQIGPAVSADTSYNSMTVSNMSVTNQDDDAAVASLAMDIHDTSHNVITSATVNDPLHAYVEVTGNAAGTPTGKVTFRYYNNVVCGGSPAGSEIVTLDASGHADMAASTLLSEEGLSFRAWYEGDITYPAADGDCTSISTSIDPTVLTLSANTQPKDGDVLTGSLSTLRVQFNRDVRHGDPADGHSADNPANYLLVTPGPNGTFDTTACGPTGIGGLKPDDIQIPVGTVNYDPATYIASLAVNGGSVLSNGVYRLFISGTTSITDPTGDAFLNGHDMDSRVTFSVAVASQTDPETKKIAKKLPSTGFAPGVATELAPQPAELAYSGTSFELEIPSLGVKESVVGVPQTGDGWDVSWLGNEIGYLQGTAFPTWNGNSVLTGHNTDADGKPGVFADLGTLTWGKQIIIHAWGQEYNYEVRTVDSQVNPASTAALTKHEDTPWLTLITCRGYDGKTGSYRWRTVVRAELVDVK